VVTRFAVLAVAFLAAFMAPVVADDRPLLLGTTTSVDNSGLLGPLLKAFRDETGIEVRTVVRGSGAILQLGRSGDFDVVLVHHPDAERAFVAGGDGLGRYPVMTSRFLIVGPDNDPAGVRAAPDAAAAMERIADEILFVHKGRLIERGDADSFFDAPQSEEGRAFVAGELLW